MELGSSNCYEGEYCWGSIFASALYDVSLHQSIGRLNVAKNLFHSIKEFRIDWDQHKESETFDFYYLLKRIISNAKNEEKYYYCQSFKKWFNDSLNYGEVEAYCQ